MEEQQKSEEQKIRESAARVANSIAERAEKGDMNLGRMEMRLGTKLNEARTRANQLMAETKQLNENIDQAKARLESLKLQSTDAIGKANGVFEALVELKMQDFEDGEEIPAPEVKAPGKKKGKKATAKGNGATKPAAQP